jgi:hypothetical protein
VLGGFVVCGYLLIATIYALATRRDNRWVVAALFGWLCASYAFIEMRMFYHWFFADYVSYRQFRDYPINDFGAFLDHLYGALVRGNHANHVTEHSPLILAIVFAALSWSGIAFYRRTVGPPNADNPASREEKLLAGLFGLTVFNAGIYALDQAGFLSFKYALHFPFSFHRVDLPNPVLWRLLFALAIVVLAVRLGRRWRWLATASLVVVTAHGLLQFPGAKGAIKDALGIPQHMGLRAALIGASPGPPDLSNPDFTPLKTYFRIEDFAKIGAVLDARLGPDKSDYRTASLGFRPSVAQYHGYHTIDGRFYDAPLAYSTRFDPIAAPERAKDGLDKVAPGGDFQIYVSEKSHKPDGLELDLDICPFVRLGGRAMFSIWKIVQPERLHLEELGRFGEIYVYVIRDEPAPCARGMDERSRRYGYFGGGLGSIFFSSSAK